MGVAPLTEATLIVARSDLPRVVRELSVFDWFHPVQTEPKELDPTVDALASRAFKLYIDLDELVKELKIKLQPGILEMLSKSLTVERERYAVKGWIELVDRIEGEAKPIIEESRRLLSEVTSLTKTLSEDRTLKAALQMISRLSIDLKVLATLKRIHAIFSVVTIKDLREIRRSLLGAVIVDAPITKSDSAVLIVSTKADAERVDKVLRSFEVKPFSIPGGLPQNPAEAYKIVEQHIVEREEKLSRAREALDSMVQRVAQKLKVLYEAAQTSYSVLEQMRKPGALKRFAVVRGYIPTSYQEQFVERFGSWLCFTQPVMHAHHGDAKASPPSLFTNRGLSKAFENITLNQGPPVYGEVDPTPIITFVFPIFYGAMFGDLGHGLVLLIFSIFLFMRGDEGLKRWATIFMLAGISASIVGILIGEIFGLSVKKLIPLLGPLEMLELVERAHEQFNTGSVMVLLQVSMIIGILHLGLGLVLNIIKGRREKVELLIERIPSVLLYVGGVLFALSFIGGGYSFEELFTSSNVTPLISFLPVAQTTIISLAIIFPCLALLMFGKAFAIKMGKLHGGSMSEVVMVGLIETLFEKVPGFLANTVSYARLGILLVVHAGLLFATNKAWVMELWVALPIVIVANIGIMLLEGLIVYIQSLRLHLYEWFTKFYDGTGTPFQKLVPHTTHLQIEWK